MLKLHKSCDTNHIFMIMSVIRQYNEISHREQISHKYLQYKKNRYFSDGMRVFMCMKSGLIT